MKTFLWYDLQVKVFMCFLEILGAIFSNQTTLGAIFAQIFSEFARVFDKSTFEDALAPRLLFQLMYCNFIVWYFLSCDILSVFLC